MYLKSKHPQLVNDGLCGSWALVPVPQRGLVLFNGNRTDDERSWPLLVRNRLR
jgi:hypothetical protein